MAKYTQEQMTVPRRLSIVPAISPTEEQARGVGDSFFQLENDMNILLNELAQDEFAGKGWDKYRSMLKKALEALRGK